MVVLAADTCSLLASVALSKDGEIVAELSSDQFRAHAEFLNSAIETLLKCQNLTLKDVDQWLLTKGPGSFTGIRIALNAVKVFSYVFGKPVMAYDSLEVLSKQSEKANVVTMMNAYKNMVYWSVFVDGSCIDGPMALPVSQILDRLQKKLNINEPIYCVGDGYSRYENLFSEDLKKILKRSESVCDYSQAKTLCKMFNEGLHQDYKERDQLHWDSLFPVYIRDSEAEENYLRNLRSTN